MSATMLRAGRLIDGAGRLWERADICIEGDRIVAVGESLPAASGAAEIPLAGATIIPGLMNCHTHICGERSPAAGGITPTQLHVEYAWRGAHWLEDALQRGVTAIRDLGGVEHVDLGLKRLVEQGKLAGPRVRSAGRAICMTGGHGYTNGVEADGPAEVRKAARGQMKAGADTIKVLATGGVMTPGTQPGSPQLTREEMAAAVEEAHKAGFGVAAHAEGRQGIRDAILAGVDSIEHGYELDDEVIGLMLERGTFLCPTLTCDIRIADFGDRLGLPPGAVEKMRRWIGHLLTSFERAHKAGVRIAAGNDAFADWVAPGDMAGEIAAMVQYGMTPHAAIIAATANAAELLRLPDEGTLVAGKRANLVILAGDPLADVAALRDVRGVLKDGAWARPFTIGVNSRP